MESKNLLSLVYLSAAKFSFSTEKLNELLAKSREKNQQQGISGMLLFKDNNFLQAIEGEGKVVLDLFRTIKKDPRHHKVATLSMEEITQRNFPDWSMGFNNLDLCEVPRPVGYTSFLETALTVADLAADPGRAKKLLLLFKEEKLLTKRANPGL
jgi:hypothetical protein